MATKIYPWWVWRKYPQGVSMVYAAGEWALKSSGVRYWGIRTPEQSLG